MNGEFILKTSEGEVKLRVSKKAFYNFEKSRGQAFLAPFAKPKGDGTVEIAMMEVFNVSIQVDLAKVCQTDTSLSADKILEIADPQSLQEFLTFALTEYLDMRGLKAAEGETVPKNS